MKQFILFIQIVLNTIYVIAQQKNLTGAYQATNNDIKTLYLLNDDYISISSFKNNTYLGTLGGPFKKDKKQLLITVEFNDKQPNTVGSTTALAFEINHNNETFIDGNKVEKVKDNKQDLDGLWRITERQSGEVMNEIPISDRKTIKMLVDGYFQWIAINPIDKGFYGTGGGLYTYQDGKYNEEIIFFSRDNSRVGNKLVFEGTIKDGKWHHSGRSSKGDPVYEIWTLENDIKKSTLF